MNKQLKHAQVDRFRKCIFDFNNRKHFHQETGMHYSTAARIIERGFASEDQIATMESYCDKVEELTTAEA